MTPGTASVALVLGGAMWGLYWLPVRALADMGLPGIWAGMLLYLAAMVLLLPALWLWRAGLRATWRGLIVSGAFTGAAFGLFTISLGYTDVVRSILLFYLTPVWGTLLGIAVLGERLSSARVLGIALGLAGLATVLGGGGGLPWPENPGDWLALCSGVAWAMGTTQIYRTRNDFVTGQIFAFLLGGLVVSLVAAAVTGGRIPPVLTSPDAVPALSAAVLAGIFVLPMTWLTLWPATLLSPGRVGLLLMSEIVVGLISAALLSGEPFGWREAMGAAMIVAAAVVEILGASPVVRAAKVSRSPSPRSR